MRVFIDTNLWVYRLDRREPAKSEHMRQWLAAVIHDHEVVISDHDLVMDATSWPAGNSSVGLTR